MSFSASATNVGLSGTTLVAELFDINKQKHRRTIDLNSVITNQDGHLRWQKEGKFGNSSSNLALNGAVLSADCRNRAGAIIRSSLNLNEQISNQDGSFGVGF
eukprot:TRINITY_DN17396_c0_g1_i1.p1 TRINITY_DN17396_c0_g1~~TRINITY_DN17396_c0_g1_i1.p1  ORF type:complete len:102 (-),score=17.38 TRINITY_DN17396_c0_g1_i1:13-318(-)